MGDRIAATLRHETYLHYLCRDDPKVTFQHYTWEEKNIDKMKSNTHNVGKHRQDKRGDNIDIVENELILFSVEHHILELTRGYSQIKGTMVSFLEVFRLGQLHHTARKRIHSKTCLSTTMTSVHLEWRDSLLARTKETPNAILPNTVTSKYFFMYQKSHFIDKGPALVYRFLLSSEIKPKVIILPNHKGHTQPLNQL